MNNKFRLFKRKQKENPSVALIRLDKILQQVQFDLSNWITVPTIFGIQITHKLEKNKQHLLLIKEILLRE